MPFYSSIHFSQTKKNYVHGGREVLNIVQRHHCTLYFASYTIRIRMYERQLNLQSQTLVYENDVFIIQ